MVTPVKPVVYGPATAAMAGVAASMSPEESATTAAAPEAILVVRCIWWSYFRDI